MTLRRDVFRFGIVGSTGFVVDGGVLLALVTSGVEALLARALSFPLAVLTTWWLNRTWTFVGADKSRPYRQFNLYFAVQLFGAFVNFVAYAIVLRFIEATPFNALLALAVGSLLGMVVNFAASRLFIFKRTAKSEVG